MTAIASVVLTGCLAVSASSDHILARDLAPAFPGFEAALPDQPVGLAPAPGVQRVLRLPELRRLAVRLNLQAEPARELCFERPVAPLERARVLAAMQKQLPAAQVEILEYSRLSVPEGDLDFPVSGLRPLPAGAIWAGSIRYGGGHRMAVWARVKVVMAAPRVIAAANLQPGHPVEVSQVRQEMRNELPSNGVFLTAIGQVEGKTLQCPVAAGTALRAQWLAAPKEVLRGEIVQVDVWSGRAHLKLPGVAEASGSKGQSIPIRNPETQKRFWATVTGKGLVSIGKESQ